MVVKNLEKKEIWLRNKYDVILRDIKFSGCVQVSNEKNISSLKSFLKKNGFESIMVRMDVLCQVTGLEFLKGMVGGSSLLIFSKKDVFLQVDSLLNLELKSQLIVVYLNLNQVGVLFDTASYSVLRQLYSKLFLIEGRIANLGLFFINIILVSLLNLFKIFIGSFFVLINSKKS